MATFSNVRLAGMSLARLEASSNMVQRVADESFGGRGDVLRRFGGAAAQSHKIEAA